MAHTPDPRTNPPAEPAAAAAQSRLRAVLGDNPYLPVVYTGVLAWLAVLSMVMVVLLLFMLNGHSLILPIAVGAVAAALLTVGGTLAATLFLLTLDDHSNRLDRLESTVAQGFAAQHAKTPNLTQPLRAGSWTPRRDERADSEVLSGASGEAVASPNLG